MTGKDGRGKEGQGKLSKCIIHMHEVVREENLWVKIIIIIQALLHVIFVTVNNNTLQTEKLRRADVKNSHCKIWGSS